MSTNLRAAISVSSQGQRSRSIMLMGVDHGGQVPTQFGVGDANANCLPRFYHIGTKRRVLWLSKYAKIRFRSGLCPELRWGTSRRSTRPSRRLGRGHTCHTPPHSAPTHLQRSPCVPQNSSQIYAHAFCQ